MDFSSDMIKDLIEQSSLCNADSDTDIQSVNVKTMVLKIINGQLSSYGSDSSSKFYEALKLSGHYQSLLKYVCSQSSVEMIGEITLVDWLEQRCFNLRKMACESQKSLLMQPET